MYLAGGVGLEPTSLKDFSTRLDMVSAAMLNLG